MPAELWGFLAPLLEAFDWTKLAVPAGAIAFASVVLYLSKKLAQREAAVQIHELQSRVKSETESHAAARITIESLKLQQASHAATAFAHLNTIAQQDKQLAKKQRDYVKLYHASEKFYRETLALREDKHELATLSKAHQVALAAVKALEDDVIGRDEKLAALRDDLTARAKQMDQAERRLKRARRLSGYLIQAKALLSRPKFKPLAVRNRAIIAVAALKGGVGKTTLTAHLAGAMARKGYRVLLLDLDLQGSLSGLMLPPATLHDCAKGKRLMQDFFVRAMESRTTRLTEYIVRSPHSTGLKGSIDIVPTSDRLAYAELNLTLGWLLKHGERDARFLLRLALHLRGPNAAYDIVLLDCPPVMNISCANALAAADYVLIPTLLTAKSMERVPKLVAAVQDEHFATHVNAHLRVLGVVANRTRMAELKGQEAIVWKNTLPNSLAAIQKQHTKLLASRIAIDVEISSNEEHYTHPKPGGRAHEMFAQLLTELEQEMPNACRKS